MKAYVQILFAAVFHCERRFGAHIMMLACASVSEDRRIEGRFSLCVLGIPAGQYIRWTEESRLWLQGMKGVADNRLHPEQYGAEKQSLPHFLGVLKTQFTPEEQKNKKLGGGEYTAVMLRDCIPRNCDIAGQLHSYALGIYAAVNNIPVHE